MSDYTPNRFSDPQAIRDLRKALGETKRAFGLRLYDLPPQAARDSVYKLETGRRKPNAAVRKLLEYIANEL